LRRSIQNHKIHHTQNKNEKPSEKRRDIQVKGDIIGQFTRLLRSLELRAVSQAKTQFKTQQTTKIQSQRPSKSVRNPTTYSKRKWGNKTNTSQNEKTGETIPPSGSKTVSLDCTLGRWMDAWKLSCRWMRRNLVVGWGIHLPGSFSL
jgi:hypothetical protein